MFALDSLILHSNNFHVVSNMNTIWQKFSPYWEPRVQPSHSQMIWVFPCVLMNQPVTMSTLWRAWIQRLLGSWKAWLTLWSRLWLRHHQQSPVLHDWIQSFRESCHVWLLKVMDISICFFFPHLLLKLCWHHLHILGIELHTEVFSFLKWWLSCPGLLENFLI